jgi:hypothetical protein
MVPLAWAFSVDMLLPETSIIDGCNESANVTM